MMRFIELVPSTSDNRGQKLAAIRRLGFRNSIIQFKKFSEKIFYLLLYFLWLLNQIFRGSSFNRKDSHQTWGLFVLALLTQSL